MSERDRKDVAFLKDRAKMLERALTGLDRTNLALKLTDERHALCWQKGPEDVEPRAVVVTPRMRTAQKKVIFSLYQDFEELGEPETFRDIVEEHERARLRK